jgi:short-subunit dehydrogenase
MAQTEGYGSAETRRLAVVTGASSGIGLELAKQFVVNGFDVVMAAEDDRLKMVASEVGAVGESVFLAQVDLAEAEGVEELYSTIVELGRHVDALALNAGVGVGGRFIETPIDADRNLIMLNVVSVVHLAKLVLPDMVQRGAGRLLITSSVAATMPGPFYATYAASKAFVQSFSEAIRHELRGSGVTVTALMPGPTDTDFFRRAHMEQTRAGRGPKDEPAEVAKDAFVAMMDGDDHVVAGALRNKAQTLAAKVLPEPMKAAIHGKFAEPRR